MKTLSLTNRRILVIFLLIGLMIIRSKFLKKKEGFKCVLDNINEPCTYKNEENYSEIYKYATRYLKRGYRKKIVNIWRSDKNILKKFDKHFEEMFVYFKTFCFVIIAKFYDSIKYDYRCLYACKKNKEKCDNNVKFLNNPIVKSFINILNKLFGSEIDPSLFEYCNVPEKYNDIKLSHKNCCIKKQNTAAKYRLYLSSVFLAIFIILLAIFLVILLYSLSNKDRLKNHITNTIILGPIILPIAVNVLVLTATTIFLFYIIIGNAIKGSKK